MIIIGITGTLGAGKGTIVNILKTEGFRHFSVRLFLTQVVISMGLPVNRDTLVNVANDLRAQHGPGYIAKQLYEQAVLSGGDCVIESIRTLGEVSVLKSMGKFYLFAVDAKPELRYERNVLRGSATDKISFDQFLRDEKREMESDDPNKQNLRACIAVADYRFSNDGTVDDLCQQIYPVLSKIFAADRN